MADSASVTPGRSGKAPASMSETTSLRITRSARADELWWRADAGASGSASRMVQPSAHCPCPRAPRSRCGRRSCLIGCGGTAALVLGTSCIPSRHRQCKRDVADARHAVPARRRPRCGGDGARRSTDSALDAGHRHDAEAAAAHRMSPVLTPRIGRPFPSTSGIWHPSDYETTARTQQFFSCRHM